MYQVLLGTGANWNSKSIIYNMTRGWIWPLEMEGILPSINERSLRARDKPPKLSESHGFDVLISFQAVKIYRDKSACFDVKMK